MVWKQRDPLTGADRDALFMADADADARSGCATGRRSSCAPTGPRCARASGPAKLRRGNVQMFFPEANPLIAPGRRDPVALVPDYNAVVEVLRAEIP